MTVSMALPSSLSACDIAMRLRDVDIQPTRQRIAIAQALLQAPVHLTADEILIAARAYLPSLSRATVYNTLPLLVDKGLLRALRLDPERTVYDSRTDAHSHIYHEDTGTLEDLPSELLHWPHLPQLPANLELLSLDLIVRVRQRHTSAPAISRD